MIDTHCHIDLYKNPLQIVNECERLGIATIGVTNLPSHFEMGFAHLLSYKKVRLALGMHPLHANSHLKEMSGFMRNLSKTSYIGEIGLDFSQEGIATKEIQLNSFKSILNALKDKPKILSLHSRKAEKEVLMLLIEDKIRSAIFHWYTGPLALIKEIVNADYYFSINTAMINSKSGQEVIGKIPKSKILTESDGPFIQYKRNQVMPWNIASIHEYLSSLWGISKDEVENIIEENFKRILDTIRTS